jgi:hypothetical protein
LDSLKGLGQFKPTTRADATKARGLGIEIIDLAGSDSTSSLGGRKGSAGSATGSQGRKKSADAGAVKTYGSSQRNREESQALNQKGKGKETTSPSSTQADIPTVSPTPVPIDALETLSAPRVFSPPPPDSQDDNHDHDRSRSHSPEDTQARTQTLEIEPTQLNDSQANSTMDIGYGQPLSIPSLPAYESTAGIETETQIDTFVPIDSKHTDKEPATTSSEQVEQSLMIKQKDQIRPEQSADDFLVAQLNRAPVNTPSSSSATVASVLAPAPTPTPKRPEPSYRKYQKAKPVVSGSSASSSLFGRLTKKSFFSMLDNSDDED